MMHATIQRILVTSSVLQQTWQCHFIGPSVASSALIYGYLTTDSSWPRES